MSEPAAACTFTVFTPTYNRAHTLARVYESLREQTFRDFEWVIVDDGSTDGTRALVAGWSSPGFPIRYFHQENSGKHVAFNRGVREARGELFLTVDSDDALVPLALERFKFHWDAIPAERRSGFSAVTALCVDQRGEVIGDRFPRDPLDSDSLELEFRYRVRGEKVGFHRTDVLRAHPFPEPEGVGFVAESVVWFAIARSYRTRFVNECLRVYYVDEPLKDNLSRLTQRTAKGRLLLHRAVLNEHLAYVSSTPLRAARSLVNYCRYSFFCGIGLPSQLRDLASPACKVAMACAAPLGYVLYLRDLARRA